MNTNEKDSDKMTKAELANEIQQTTSSAIAEETKGKIWTRVAMAAIILFILILMVT